MVTDGRELTDGGATNNNVQEARLTSAYMPRVRRLDTPMSVPPACGPSPPTMLLPPRTPEAQVPQRRGDAVHRERARHHARHDGLHRGLVDCAGAGEGGGGKARGGGKGVICQTTGENTRVRHRRAGGRLPATPHALLPPYRFHLHGRVLCGGGRWARAWVSRGGQASFDR